MYNLERCMVFVDVDRGLGLAECVCCMKYGVFVIEVVIIVKYFLIMIHSSGTSMFDVGSPRILGLRTLRTLKEQYPDPKAAAP